MLEIAGLRKTFKESEGGEEIVAVDNVTFTVQQGEFFTLLGPSGCGKTTTMRSIAGLEYPDDGEISVGGRILFSASKGVHVRPDQRRLGMVFQSYAIWPHMSVFKNVSFPLDVMPRNRRLSRSERAERVERALQTVRLEGLSKRPATDLSGGQQQRLALARALVFDPDVLLLDEPLSNLDAKLREDMRDELKRLQSEFNVATVYVTHDQIEALALSDTIAVMNNGAIEQSGSPKEIYERPASRFVSDFIGVSNQISGRIKVAEDGRILIENPAGTLWAKSNESFQIGDEVTVFVRRDKAMLVPMSSYPRATGYLAGVLGIEAFLGEYREFTVELEHGLIVKARSERNNSLKKGDRVMVQIDEQHCFVPPMK